MAIRVALVEDDDDLRKLTSSILNFYQDLECVGAFESAEALGASIGALQPEVVLMDIGLPGQDGIACVGRLKPLYRNIQFVMLTSQNDPQKTFAALQAGATGYILKTSAPEKIAESVREVVNGGSPMSAAIARLIVESFQKDETQAPELEKLTKTEREVLDDLEAGHSYKEIAARRFVDMSTVQSHIRHIYEKLQVHSRTEAVNKAFGRKKDSGAKI
jgi:DNA-binding NarL/FixJ family response regulator